MKDRWKANGADSLVAATRKRFELGQASLKFLIPRSHSIVTILPVWEKAVRIPGFPDDGLIRYPYVWDNPERTGRARKRLPDWPEVPNEIVTYIGVTSSIPTQVGGAEDPPRISDIVHQTVSGVSNSRTSRTLVS